MAGDDYQLLARFDALLRLLDACVDEHERALRVSEFAAEENQRCEQTLMESLRARDDVSDEELLRRIQQAPEMGRTALFGATHDVSGRGDDLQAADPSTKDLKRWMTVGFVGFLTVVFGTVAILGARVGAARGLVVLAAALCGVSALAAVVLAAHWLRRFDVPLEDQVDADLAWMLEAGKHRRLADGLAQLIDQELDFKAFPRRPSEPPNATTVQTGGAVSSLDETSHFFTSNRASAMHSLNVSAPHLAMSDDLLRDALYGAQSPRGSADAAFDSGYFALLSVLGEDERRTYEHPSRKVLEITCSRLALDTAPGLRLLKLRYSADVLPQLAEVLAWAEDVRQRIRRLESE